MYLEGSTLDLSNIQIAREDGDDVETVAGVSSLAAARVSGAASGVSPEELGIGWRFRFLLCDDELARETGVLGCSIGGGGR